MPEAQAFGFFMFSLLVCHSDPERSEGGGICSSSVARENADASLREE
jgi:hypothetical protein